MKDPDVNDYSVVHLSLILSLHCLVKRRSGSLAVYNNEFKPCSVCVCSEITETTKSLKICYMFNSNRICFKIVRR